METTSHLLDHHHLLGQLCERVYGNLLNHLFGCHAVLK